MARAKSESNGHLDEAMADLARAQTNLVQAQASLAQNHATLIQTQAILVQNHAAFEASMNASRKEAEERFARIEASIAELIRLIHAMPDAVRGKFGFQPPN